MAAIGRLDLANGIRRLLDLSGEYAPAIGEGVVPTIQISDLTRSPFSVALPWSYAAGVAAVLAQYGWVVLVPGASLPVNAWIQVDRIHITGDATGFQATVNPLLAASVPVLGSLIAAGICNRQGGPNAGSVKRDIPEVNIQSGASATVGPSTGIFLYSTTKNTFTLEGNWAVSQLGGLAIVSSLTNRDLSVAFDGSIHYTTVR